MIRLDNPHTGQWSVTQHASLGNIERERVIGYVLRVPSKQTFNAYLHSGKGESIAITESLPTAINALIDFHKLTDYQYAPWPSMEEDEE